MDDVLLNMYLALFFEAWKKGYKLGWIYNTIRNELDEKSDFDAFMAHAHEHRFPLFTNGEHCVYNCRYLLIIVNKHFSDWVLQKNPSMEKFVENVLKNRDRLLVKAEQFKTEQARASRDLRARQWDALDAFGGKVAELSGKQLAYLNMGRTTGPNAGKEIRTVKS